MEEAEVSAGHELDADRKRGCGKKWKQKERKPRPRLRAQGPCGSFGEELPFLLLQRPVPSGATALQGFEMFF